MQKHNDIKALFLLSIFGLLFLHQVSPHQHHQHDVKHTHKTVAHSDTHKHHEDVPDEENSDKGLFDVFFEMHTHSVVSNEIVTTQEHNEKQNNVKKELKSFISTNYYNSSTTQVETETVRIYHPPEKYFNAHLAYPDSRGPPSLG